MARTIRSIDALLAADLLCFFIGISNIKLSAEFEQSHLKRTIYFDILCFWKWNSFYNYNFGISFILNSISVFHEKHCS
ncbi:hypothetical protein BOSE62_40477 [Bosea sp. 62]|nr:hypothetical protein BOSE46_120307 [Bosea sp. 46]CAD5261232.1 hypothetical protein BOSE21B_110529 [Bosea sp. 21B]CAD5279392.1 hypothetical protein BOSE7B_40687 [Bosea sp. 7B]VVT58427.1 hypothetical protein BOS5A_200580 [Bosea sp. EC-HK365B]VXB53844.1 hypothetical protein BOSE29B_110472 [Bosea sp. 29B]VXB95666.1 hypothetical protein BOSE125_160264 [Bosea sp. 125]VXC45731.1 hypothetical protein BOSE62_40477 [Bosea sp. 62]VXC82867.1 hypothetical protein BOSE127_60085 [Bosea sp. 127]